MCKRLLLAISLALLGLGVFNPLPVAAHGGGDSCGEEFTYYKSWDYDDSRVNINFSSSDEVITVTPKSGYSLVLVQLDVESDGHSGYWTYPVQAGVAFNPNPGGDIDSAKVVVEKNCPPNTASFVILNTCQGWRVDVTASAGGTFTEPHGYWSNPFALESKSAGSVVVTFPSGSPRTITLNYPKIYEPRDCQVAHETEVWAEDSCDGYVYGYILDGKIVEVGSGVWQNPYGPEAVTFEVVVPIPEGELGEDVFVITIDKDRECIQCKVTALYPQATYLDPNAPETYWQGPFELGPGACSVIHPAGQTPSADRVTVICSLCEDQIKDGFIYHGEHQFLDGWVYKVECYGYETHYWYEGYNWDKWVRLGMYDDQGNRTCNRIEGCADWIKEQAGIQP